MWVPVPAGALNGWVSFDLNFLIYTQYLNYVTETLQDSLDYPQQTRSGPCSSQRKRQPHSSRTPRLRPTHPSVISTYLLSFTRSIYVQKRTGPTDGEGVGARETHGPQASPHGAFTVLPGFALGVPAAGTWLPSEKPPPCLPTPGKTQQKKPVAHHLCRSVL